MGHTPTRGTSMPGLVDMHGIARVLPPACAPSVNRSADSPRRGASDVRANSRKNENIPGLKTPFFNDRGPSTPMPTSDPVQLFCLDRDGVINSDVGVPGVTDVRDFEL